MVITNPYFILIKPFSDLYESKFKGIRQISLLYRYNEKMTHFDSVIIPLKIKVSRMTESAITDPTYEMKYA